MHDWGWFGMGGMGGMVLFWVAVVLVIALRAGGGVAAAAGPVDLAAGSRTQGKLGTRYGQMAAAYPQVLISQRTLFEEGG